jgi:hypothetical protein
MRQWQSWFVDRRNLGSHTARSPTQVGKMPEGLRHPELLQSLLLLAREIARSSEPPMLSSKIPRFSTALRSISVVKLIVFRLERMPLSVFGIFAGVSSTFPSGFGNRSRHCACANGVPRNCILFESNSHF